MNKHRYQVKQDPTETGADFVKRIQSLESLSFDKNIFKDREATEGKRKFMNNLKDMTRNEIKISEIVKSFPSAEEIFLINSNWSYISNMLKRKFGFNNPAISANEYDIEINELPNEIQSGKSPITVVAPTPATSTTSILVSVTGCRLVGCSVVSGRSLRSHAVSGVSWHVCVCLGPVLASHDPSPPAAAAAAWRGRGRVPMAGWSYDRLGPERGLRGGGRRGWWSGEARTILLLHIISVRPSKQPLMVRTFLKVYMELGSSFCFCKNK